MTLNKDEIIRIVKEENIKTVILAFCDIFGREKNITIMPEELSSAFKHGVAFDASEVKDFGEGIYRNLILHPEPETFSDLPWRPENDQAVRMFCNMTYADGAPFERRGTKSLLIKALSEAEKSGYEFYFGTELEFYLFKTDSDGKPTKEPYDDAMLYDIPPEDKCDEIRRKICLTLEEMGARPNNAFHEAGPGQNKITFGYYNPLTAGNHFTTLKTIIKNEAANAGLYADFSPKPLPDMPGNGFHINISVRSNDGGDNHMAYAIAGILKRIREIAAFLNPSEESFKRLSVKGAPKYISWTSENHAHLLKVPEYVGAYRQAELRSPDSTANPYLAFALIIYACLEGINNQYELPPVANFSFRTMPQEVVSQYELFPHSFEEASEIARNSEFVKKYVPEDIINMYLNRK